MFLLNFVFLAVSSASFLSSRYCLMRACQISSVIPGGGGLRDCDRSIRKTVRPVLSVASGGIHGEKSVGDLHRDANNSPLVGKG